MNKAGANVPGWPSGRTPPPNVGTRAAAAGPAGYITPFRSAQAADRSGSSGQLARFYRSTANGRAWALPAVGRWGPSAGFLAAPGQGLRSLPQLLQGPSLCPRHASFYSTMAAAASSSEGRASSSASAAGGSWPPPLEQWLVAHGGVVNGVELRQVLYPSGETHTRFRVTSYLQGF